MGMAMLVLPCSNATAAIFDAYIKCQKAYRPKEVTTTNPHTTVVALESYLTCKTIYWPTPYSDDIAPRDGGALTGPSPPDGKRDITEMSCDKLDADRKAMIASKAALNAARDNLDIALANAFSAHDVAVATARAARTKSGADTLQCENVTDLDDASRAIIASRKCHISRIDLRDACIDRQMALLKPDSNVEQVCSVATASAIDSRAADNAELLAAHQVREIWNERADIAREIGRLQRRIDSYNAEYRSRCP